MPVADLADLFVSTSDYVGRADFAHLFPRFVAMTELDIERRARFSDQHASATLTLVSRQAALPVDFLAVRAVRTTGSPSWDLDALAIDVDLNPSEDQPRGYRIDGGTFRAYGEAFDQVRLDYFAKVPRLTGAAPTNWLLTKAPDALLMGCILQVMIWGKDERAGDARQGFESALDAAMRADRAGRYQNAVMTVAGGLP